MSKSKKAEVAEVAEHPEATEHNHIEIHDLLTILAKQRIKANQDEETAKTE